MKMNKTESDGSSETKVCKKCSEPLSSKSKYKLCENCRRERAKLFKQVGGTFLAVGVTVLSVIPGVKRFLKK